MQSGLRPRGQGGLPTQGRDQEAGCQEHFNRLLSLQGMHQAGMRFFGYSSGNHSTPHRLTQAVVLPLRIQRDHCAPLQQTLEEDQAHQAGLAGAHLPQYKAQSVRGRRLVGIQALFK